MSRVQKLAAWLSNGQNEATLDEYITDWSPNNLKTIVVSGKQVAIEWFIPVNGVRRDIYLIEDIALDIKSADLGHPVKSILKVLTQDRIYSNVEEIIITTDSYNKGLFKTDSDFSELCVQGASIENTFGRLYAITKTNCSFQDIWALICQVQDGEHMHYADILEENRAKYTGKSIAIRKFNQDNWFKRITLMDKFYDLDRKDELLHKYLTDVMYVMSGETAFDDVVADKESLVALLTTIPLQNVSVPEPVEVDTAVLHLQFMRNDLFNEQMSGNKVRFLLADSLLDAIEEHFGYFYSIESVILTVDNQIIINDQLIKPAMSYTMLMALPISLFEALLNMTKEDFKRIALETFQRTPELDADYFTFVDWLCTLSLNWGCIFNAKDLCRFSNLSRINIRNPYRALTVKMEIGLLSWGSLYDKLPSLSSDGLYLGGMRITKENESEYTVIEKELKDMRGIVLTTNTNKYFIPQVISLDDDTKAGKAFDKILGKQTSEKVKSKFASIGAKATTLYRKLDIN